MPYLTIDSTDWPVQEDSAELDYLPVQQWQRNVDGGLLVDEGGHLLNATWTIGPLTRAAADTLMGVLRSSGNRTVGGDVLSGSTLPMRVQSARRRDVPHRPANGAPTWMPVVVVTFVQVTPS